MTKNNLTQVFDKNYHKEESVTIMPTTYTNYILNLMGQYLSGIYR